MEAHIIASNIIEEEVLSAQVPELVLQKRGNYFPFAVKVSPVNG